MDTVRGELRSACTDESPRHERSQWSSWSSRLQVEPQTWAAMRCTRRGERGSGAATRAVTVIKRLVHLTRGRGSAPSRRDPTAALTACGSRESWVGQMQPDGRRRGGLRVAADCVPSALRGRAGVMVNVPSNSLGEPSRDRKTASCRTDKRGGGYGSATWLGSAAASWPASHGARVLRSLQDVDVDLFANVIAADTVVGTSAGSTVAAQILSGTLPDALSGAQLSRIPPTSRSMSTCVSSWRGSPTSPRPRALLAMTS